MSVLPVLKSKEIITALLRAGFRLVRSRGSHFRLEDILTKRSVTVSLHRGRDVPRKTLKSILDQSGITIEKLLQYLKSK